MEPPACVVPELYAGLVLGIMPTKAGGNGKKMCVGWQGAGFGAFPPYRKESIPSVARKTSIKGNPSV